MKVIEAEVVTVYYTNHRGLPGNRTIMPLAGTLRFAEVEWHPGPQWVMDAFDLDRRTVRTFAMKDIHSWRAGDAR